MKFFSLLASSQFFFKYGRTTVCLKSSMKQPVANDLLNVELAMNGDSRARMSLTSHVGLIQLASLVLHRADQLLNFVDGHSS